MTDLLVQGPGLTDRTLDQLVEAARPAAVGRRPSLARLQGTPRTEALIDWCDAARLDWAWLDRPIPAAEIRLLAMDMDSTLITIECIDELARIAGVGDQVAGITAAAMRGELDFPGALRRRVALLAGLRADALEQVYHERLRLSPGAEALLAGARTRGWKVLLVSGGFTFFTGRLQERLGLDFTLANELEISQGRLTGQVLGPIIDGAAKAARLEQACRDLGCPPGQAVVIGDGANDLPMIRLAGLGVAYRAKPVVCKQAAAAVNHSGLDAVLGFLD